MKNPLLFLSLILITISLFGQNGYQGFMPRFDSMELETLKQYGIYFNDKDLIQNRIDTLSSSYKVVFTDNDEKIISQEENLITFYEYENLLVLSSDSNIEKKIIFLDFLYEMGENDSCEKNFFSESGERIFIKYKIDKYYKKTISHISITSDKKNEHIISYFK